MLCASVVLHHWEGMCCFASIESEDYILNDFRFLGCLCRSNNPLCITIRFKKGREATLEMWVANVYVPPSTTAKACEGFLFILGIKFRMIFDSGIGFSNLFWVLRDWILQPVLSFAGDWTLQPVLSFSGDWTLQPVLSFAGDWILQPILSFAGDWILQPILSFAGDWIFQPILMFFLSGAGNFTKLGALCISVNTITSTFDWGKCF